LFDVVHPILAQQNTPPIISAIPDQVTNEDVPLAGIPFTVWDAETPPDQLRFSPTSTFSDGSFIIGGVLISGAGTNRLLSVFPPADKSGTMSVRIDVRDPGGLGASTVFRVEVRPVNDPPRISAIADQVALKGQGLFRVPFSA